MITVLLLVIEMNIDYPVTYLRSLRDQGFRRFAIFLRDWKICVVEALLCFLPCQSLLSLVGL